MSHIVFPFSFPPSIIASEDIVVDLDVSPGAKQPPTTYLCLGSSCGFLDGICLLQELLFFSLMQTA